MKYPLTLSTCILILLSGIISVSHYTYSTLHPDTEHYEEESTILKFILKNKSISNSLFGLYNVILNTTTNSNLDNNSTFQGDDFYFSAANKFKDQILAKNLKDEKTLNKIFKDYITKRKQLTKLDATYYSFIFPESFTIYSQKTPYHWKKILPDTSAKKQILSFFQEKNDAIRFYDLTHTLKEKSNSNLLYIPNDTHWNEYAAYIAYQEILDAMHERFPLLRKDEVLIDTIIWLRSMQEKAEHKAKMASEFHFPYVESTIYHLCGLTRSLNMPDRIIDSIPCILTKEKNQCQLDSIKKSIVINYAEYSSDADSDLSAIVFCDSFMEPVMKYLSPHFKTVRYIYGYYNQNTVKKYSPDIVIEAHVERMFTKF